MKDGKLRCAFKTKCKQAAADPFSLEEPCPTTSLHVISVPVHFWNRCLFRRPEIHITQICNQFLQDCFTILIGTTIFDGNANTQHFPVPRCRTYGQICGLNNDRNCIPCYNKRGLCCRSRRLLGMFLHDRVKIALCPDMICAWQCLVLWLIDVDGRWTGQWGYFWISIYYYSYTLFTVTLGDIK